MEPNSYALNSRAQLIVLQQLVECVLLALPTQQQAAALAAFSQACQSTMATTLNAATRDSTVDAIDSAQVAQIRRLQARGLQVPPLPRG